MDREMPVGLRFSILHRQFRRRLDERLEEKGLTGVQFGTLCALRQLEIEGMTEISQRELEKFTHTAHPTMTEIIKKLEKKGFFLCRSSQRDRRCKVLASTEKGQALFEEAADLDVSVFNELTKEMDAQQKTQILQLIDAMLKQACVLCEKGNENSD